MAKDKPIPCLIHIPCTMPNGSDIDPEQMNSFLELLDRQFGGSTPLGVVDGRWVAPDGQTVAEKMLRVEVTVKKSQIPAFEKVAKVIGRQTKQEVMYVVINYQAETRFLFVEEDDDDAARGTAG
ncbi:MAG: hypothetical protein HY000_31405 [Planctomycetes bacterium]|nr:hypothetical protein [Planctomycetota bacterium]